MSVRIMSIIKSICFRVCNIYFQFSKLSVSILRFVKRRSMNTEQSPPPYSPYYPPQYPNATQGNAGQPTAGVMPPVVVHVDMGMPDSGPPEYTQGFENENCFSDAVIRRGQLYSLEMTSVSWLCYYNQKECLCSFLVLMFLDVLNNDFCVCIYKAKIDEISLNFIFKN